MKQEFMVDAGHDGLRLDCFLVEQFPDRSRSRIQKWVKAGMVTVNGKEESKHHFLDEGDLIVVEINEDAPAKATQQADQQVEVLFEDDDIIVLNKPNTILTHPAQRPDDWTIAHFLRQYCPEVEGVGEEADRPGIVHRLDKKASGVMVAAKNQEAYEKMKQQFMDRRVEKEYRAIVHGVPVNETDIIKFRLAHSKTKSGKMAARPEHEEGRDAWTEYDVLETKNKRYALLAVRIKTGRTHQIRAHLAAIDHPIVGDLKYVTSRWENGKKEYPRMFLHAYRLAFTHPTTGERVEFVAPPPQSFTDFLRS